MLHAERFSNLKTFLISRRQALAIGVIFFHFCTPFFSDELGKSAIELLLVSWLILYKQPLRHHLRSKFESIWMRVCIIYFLYICLNILFLTDSHRGGPRLEVYGKYVLVIPLFYILKRTTLTSYHFFILLNTATIFAGFSAILDLLISTQDRVNDIHGRPNVYGGLVAITTLCCALSYPLAKQFQLCRLTAISILFGLSGLFIAESRGAWLTLVTLPFLIRFEYLTTKITKQKLFIILIILLLLVYFVGGFEIIARRFEDTSNDLYLFFTGHSDSNRTSIGARFEMWRVGFDLYLSAPTFGVGIGDIQKILNDQGHSAISQFTHLHNEYIHILATQGWFGLALWSFIIYSLFSYYIKARSNNLRLANLGVWSTMATSVLCLTNSYLSSNIGLGFFIIFNTILIHVIESESKSPPERSLVTS